MREMETDLVFNDGSMDRTEMKVGYNTDNNDSDFVSFEFRYKGTPVSFSGKEDDVFFNLNKFKVGCLIDYLQRMHDNMIDNNA